MIDMLMDPLAVKGYAVPSLSELNDEIVMLLSAGNDTTSTAMIFGIYRISSNPQVYNKVFKELQTNFPSLKEKITYEQAKRLPYLVRSSHIPWLPED